MHSSNRSFRWKAEQWSGPMSGNRQYWSNISVLTLVYSMVVLVNFFYVLCLCFNVWQFHTFLMNLIHVCTLSFSFTLFLHLLEPIFQLLLLCLLFVCRPQRLIIVTCPSMGKKWCTGARAMYLAVGLKKGTLLPQCINCLYSPGMGGPSWFLPHPSIVESWRDQSCAAVNSLHHASVVGMLIPSEFSPPWTLVWIAGSGPK